MGRLRSELLRTLAGICGLGLMLVAAWGVLLVLLFIPLEGPDALEACADPCFGPPRDYGEVFVGAASAAATAALCGTLAASGWALLAVASRRRRPSLKRLALSPLLAAAVVIGAVCLAQAIATI